MLKRLSTLGFIMVLSFYLRAQQDTSFALEDVSIVSQRIQNLSSGIKYQTLDSAAKSIYQHKDLSELLNFESPIFIKSQGPGNLATTSFRGGSASHTAVVWNGFNINSTTTGLVDLSLVPNVLHDGTSIQYGSSTSLWGSGALGGAIHLQSQPKFNNSVSGFYSANALSYSDYDRINSHSHALGFSKGTKQFYGAIKLFHSQNDNYFSYSEANRVISGRDNNPVSNVLNTGALIDLYWRIQKNQTLELHYWYQNLERNISPSLSESDNNSFLSDRTDRIALQYSLLNELGEWTLRAAFFNKDLLFKSDILEDAPSKSSNILADAIWTYNTDSKDHISFGLNQNFSVAENQNYAELIVDSNKLLVKQDQYQFAIFGAYKKQYSNGKGSSSISLRQEWVNGVRVPITFSIGSQYQLIKKIQASLRFSKIYRIPNINDLYWNPGGNPDLQSEDGYALEATIRKEHDFDKNWKAKLEYTVYYRRVNNWIQWVPGIIWSPQNLLEVESYGNELDVSTSYSVNKWQAGLRLNFAYIVSQNIRSNSNIDLSIRKQLIYAPLYKGNSSIFTTYGKWRLSYNHQYVGYTYVSSDHSEFLNPYDPASIRLSYSKSIGNRLNSSFWFSVNNLYNESYEIIVGRPLPLRHYNIGIQITLN